MSPACHHLWGKNHSLWINPGKKIRTEKDWTRAVIHRKVPGWEGGKVWLIGIELNGSSLLIKSGSISSVLWQAKNHLQVRVHSVWSSLPGSRSQILEMNAIGDTVLNEFSREYIYRDHQNERVNKLRMKFTPNNIISLIESVENFWLSEQKIHMHTERSLLHQVTIQLIVYTHRHTPDYWEQQQMKALTIFFLLWPLGWSVDWIKSSKKDSTQDKKC